MVAEATPPTLSMLSMPFGANTELERRYFGSRRSVPFRQTAERVVFVRFRACGHHHIRLYSVCVFERRNRPFYLPYIRYYLDEIRQLTVHNSYIVSNIQLKFVVYTVCQRTQHALFQTNFNFRILSKSNCLHLVITRQFR